MKKIILLLFAALMLLTVCQSEAATVYNFTVTNINSGASVLGLDLNISGNWSFGQFDSYYLTSGSTPWTKTLNPQNVNFLNVGDSTSDGSVPLKLGLVFTLISNNDGPLAITFIDPYDINSVSFPQGTVSASLNAVPIPAAVWLLGSGVVGLVALKRRKKA